MLPDLGFNSSFWVPFKIYFAALSVTDVEGIVSGVKIVAFF